jgi:DNA-binding MarR family transcriptional regulator
MTPSEDHPLNQLNPLNLGEVDSLAEIIMVMQRRFLSSLMGELARGKVSFPQFFLLGHLSSQGPSGMSCIAALMDHSMPAATGLVQRLERLGYVKRSKDKDDQRKVLVQTTTKGSRLVEGVRTEMATNLAKVMDLLEPTEQRSWLNIYKKIHAYCESNYR